MTPARRPYDDAATPADMTGDCRAVTDALHLPAQPGRPSVDSAAHAFLAEYVGREHPVPAVSAALADRAADLELHLD